jgi:hypothetical protein
MTLLKTIPSQDHRLFAAKAMSMRSSSRAPEAQGRRVYPRKSLNETEVLWWFIAGKNPWESDL